MHPRLSNDFGACVCLLADRLFNDYVRNSLPIFTKFCMPLRNMVESTPIVSKTNRKQTVGFLEMCKFRFWQFFYCGCRILLQIITKIPTELKLMSDDFALRSRRNRSTNQILERCKVRFRHPFHPFSYEYVHNSLPIFTKFCLRLGNVVGLTPIGSEKTESFCEIYYDNYSCRKQHHKYISFFRSIALYQSLLV